MNSYPTELLAQLSPVMFVAGLDVPPPPAGPGSEVSTPDTNPPKPNEFTILIQRLRDSLQAHRKVAIWQPEKNKAFQIILVDKQTQFPPRKLVPPEDPQYSHSHSPLSPLTPTSPLYPDGLIAPIWIRKHTTLIPSVFVLFLRIYEHPAPNSNSPLDLSDGSFAREREQEERRQDMELAAEIAARKRSTNERGMKLTVVLMASRKLLDDPTLDTRLSFVRRQSGLDSRAALFVLSPVSPSELGEFIKSLQQALYDPAIEYYTAHSKRVRRKRNRHPQHAPPSLVTGPHNVPRPLRPEGWTVRYEYKMACFAEFRGEDEVALKHYQDAHSTLALMFGSAALLPPRTKRWAEAKVLADCINIKIAKLYLYNNEHALALSHHNSHIRLFSDFSRGWGIGEDTYEYWSWIARQHRIFAELLELGLRSTLTIPSHKPTMPSSAVSPRSGAGAIPPAEADTLRAMSINPSHALQHPGFYYYMAARCTEKRRERFAAALEVEETMVTSPGFVNEKKVEHLAIILELYTKAYELFKKYSTPGTDSTSQSRFTLWIAYRIAQTYYATSKFDMALRFFERIGKTYRREQWGPLLNPLLSTWYTCSIKSGDISLSIKLLVEMLGHDSLRGENVVSAEADLNEVLKNNAPSSEEPLTVELPEAFPIFDSNVVFWKTGIHVDEPVPFQLSLTAPSSPSIANIPFSSLTIFFSHNEDPFVIRHAESEEESGPVRNVPLGSVSSTDMEEDVVTDLRWQPGGTIVFYGTMILDAPGTLSARYFLAPLKISVAHLPQVSKLNFTLEEGPWRIEIPCNPCSFRYGQPPVVRWYDLADPGRSLPLRRGESSTEAIVKHRKHELAVALEHQQPAYLNETYPIAITITNFERRELDLAVDVLLQPVETDGAVNTIRLEAEESSNFIKGVSFGRLQANASVTKTLYLINSGAPGDRVLDISIQSSPTTESKDEETQDITETLKTITIPCIDPIKVVHSVSYRQNMKEWPGLVDLNTLDGDVWDDRMAGEALVTTRFVANGPSGLVIENVELERQESGKARVLNSSTDVELDSDIFELMAGDEFAHICRVGLLPTDPGEEPSQNAGLYQVKWRRTLPNGDLGTIAWTRVSLPPLRPPVEGLIALLSVPPEAVLHKPFPLAVTVRNCHAVRSANITIQLELDASDGFIVVGLRSGRIPILLPGSEQKIIWRLVPIECGQVKVPRIRIMDRRASVGVQSQGQGESQGQTEGQPQQRGEAVKIVDVRLAIDSGTEVERHVEGAKGVRNDSEIATVFVLPP